MGVVLRRTSLAVLPLFLVFLFIAQLFRVTADEQTAITGEPAYLLLGHPDSIAGSSYGGPVPGWIEGVAKIGGQWVSNGWAVAATDTNDVFLLIDLKRNSADGNLCLDVAYRAEAGSALFLDLLDEDDVAVVAEQGGNLIEANTQPAVARRIVPLAEHPNAPVLRLRGGGTFIVYHVSLIPLPTPAVTGPAGISGSAADALEDVAPALADAASMTGEANVGQQATPAATGVVGRAGASTNGLFGGRGRGKTIFVDQHKGRDLNSGRKPAGASLDGPVATLARGQRLAGNGDTLRIRDGAYPETLNVAGRAVRVVVDGRVDMTGGSPARRSLPGVSGTGTNGVRSATISSQEEFVP